MQEGLDFDGLFIVDGGGFIDGARNVSFDSSEALLDIELENGVDGESWVAALPDQVLKSEVLTSWSVEPEGCRT